MGKHGLCSAPPFVSAVFSYAATFCLRPYLAEEMTSLCLSESKILARWDATESAYWVMWI